MDDLCLEPVSESPLDIFSLFDRAGLALPSRLLPGLPRKKEDPVVFAGHQHFGRKTRNDGDNV